MADNDQPKVPNTPKKRIAWALKTVYNGSLVRMAETYGVTVQYINNILLSRTMVKRSDLTLLTLGGMSESFVLKGWLPVNRPGDAEDDERKAGEAKKGGPAAAEYSPGDNGDDSTIIDVEIIFRCECCGAKNSTFAGITDLGPAGTGEKVSVVDTTCPHAVAILLEEQQIMEVYEAVKSRQSKCRICKSTILPEEQENKVSLIRRLFGDDGE